MKVRFHSPVLSINLTSSYLCICMTSLIAAKFQQYFSDTQVFPLQILCAYSNDYRTEMYGLRIILTQNPRLDYASFFMVAILQCPPFHIASYKLFGKITTSEQIRENELFSVSFVYLTAIICREWILMPLKKMRKMM